MFDLNSPPSYFPGFRMYDDPPKGMTVKQWQYKVGQQCLLYAIHRFNNLRNYQLNKMNQLYNSFNGLINEQQFQYLNQTYGKDNLVRYKDYRLGRAKMELLIGEWLGRERMNKVSSINPEAKSQLFEDYAFQLGLKHNADNLKKLRQNDVPVLRGIEPLDIDDDKIFELLSSKRKSTLVMQILLDKGIEVEDIWTKLASTFHDTCITSECFAKVEIDKAGYSRMREIDPREALYEESDRDPFLLRSPYVGEHRVQFIHDALSKWQFSETEFRSLKEGLQEARTQTATTGNQMRRNGFQYLSKQLGIETWSMEWMSVKTLFVKETPSKIFGKPYREMLDYEYYQANRSNIEKKVKRGDFKIEANPMCVVWEANRIGNSVYKDVREKPNQLRSIKNPFLAEYSYSGMIFRNHDGVRISIFNTLDHISELYNIVMLQIRRELNKLKGKILSYDIALLPGKYKGSIDGVVVKMINDGILEIDSSNDKVQFAGGASALAGMLKEFDLGLSANFPQLISLKQELERTTEVLTGISNSRSGNTPASMTATNAVNQINVSRSATEFLFHMHHTFCKNVVRKFLQSQQISYGYHHPEEAQRLLGDKGAMYLDVIKKLPLEYFDAMITDGKRESELREMMKEWFPQALNAHELRTVDAMEASMAESIDMAIGIVKNGWVVVQKQQADAAAAQNQAKNQMMQSQMGMKNQALADERKFKIFQEIVKGLLDAGAITQQAMNEYTLMAQQFLSQGQPAAGQTEQIEV